jgi:hypothetical protein
MRDINYDHKYCKYDIYLVCVIVMRMRMRMSFAFENNFVGGGKGGFCELRDLTGV